MAKNQANLLEKIWEALKVLTVKVNRIETSTAVMNSEMNEVKNDIKDIKTGFVTVERFSPVEKISYFIAGTIGGGIILTLLYRMLALVIK